MAAAVALAGLQSAQRAPAMVGGAPPAPTEFARSIVMVLGSGGTSCTGTAIGRDLLLTAAHCVQPGADYKLLGSEPGQAPVLKNIIRIERHPQFDITRLFNHLATADYRREFRLRLLPPAKALLLVTHSSSSVTA
jgi:hypothetical protein